MHQKQPPAKVAFARVSPGDVREATGVWRAWVAAVFFVEGFVCEVGGVAWSFGDEVALLSRELDFAGGVGVLVGTH